MGFSLFGFGKKKDAAMQPAAPATTMPSAMPMASEPAAPAPEQN